MSEVGEIKLCKRGHPRTPENTCPDGRCRLCKNERDRERRRERYATDEAYRERRLAWKRERYATDEAFRERKDAQNREWWRARYATDEAFREREKARNRARYATDEAYREREKARERERWATDEAYRERRLARDRERWGNDPEYRERKGARFREWYYSTDPEVHKKILAYAVRRDLRRREQRLASRQARLGNARLGDPIDVQAIITEVMSDG